MKTNWTKDYQAYLNWAIHGGLLIVMEHTFDYMDTEDMDSAIFGYWYTEVKK
jgi:hypothetical protein